MIVSYEMGKVKDEVDIDPNVPIIHYQKHKNLIGNVKVFEDVKKINQKPRHGIMIHNIFEIR